MKTITIDQFLTPDEIKVARKMYQACKEEGTLSFYAKNVSAVLIRPNMARINAKLGQENDPMYLAYAVEYVMMQSEPR